MFVCYFCMSACLVKLHTEVRGLRKVLSLVKRELKEMRQEYERLKRSDFAGEA